MIKKIDEYRYLVPKTSKAGMKIDGLIYANDRLIKQIEKDQTVDQVANVATLPGFVGKSLAMPDAHQGYGFCIGGVAAADIEDGVVSAGGVGFDINCGVRLLRSPFEKKDIISKLDELLNQLFKDIPCGTGRKGKLSAGKSELNKVLQQGVEWAVKNDYGNEEDIYKIEECGKIERADESLVSSRAKERGHDQLGTLGSGNHFLEIQVVAEIYDDIAARCFSLYKDQVVVLIHSGSRGLGHQVCTDYLDVMQSGMKKYKIDVSDRQLASVPIKSIEGQNYLKAMAASANFVFANRQMITHWTRDVFKKIIGSGDLKIVYDICHNIAKFEEHEVDGSLKSLLVHRKGATRAFPKKHPVLPDEYKSVGQPVLIPGSMGTCSYVLVGTENAMKETFGSSCHGAGRSKSRTQAKKETDADELLREMKSRGILVRGETKSGLSEENPNAYKDVSEVVEVVHGAGIAKKVAKLVPLAVMKG
ncbi:MAG: RtcB family protein [Ignavibacteriales bacterium]|nr:RtcB family protein [Ignavibacteriales bacterium]